MTIPGTLPPIAGRGAIRQFWFPSSPSTRVVAMELSIDSVHVDGAPRTQRSWHVNVLRRQRDGSWLIWKRMWGDLR